MNVFFAGGGTGGHLYPALAIARALVRADSRIEPFFIGARRGIERDVLPGSGFPFELLDLHPLYRAAPVNNWRTVMGAVSAWRRLAEIAKTRPPVALIATGGYVAGVALAYASRRRIPIVIQEQNSFPGMTVRYFASRAAQIHLGFPEAAAFLRLGPNTQLLNSGNPIDPPPLPRPDRREAVAHWGFSSGPDKTLLVFGGSQGAEAINQVLKDWIVQFGGERGGAGGISTAGVGVGVGEGVTGKLGVRVIWATGKGTYQTYQQLESADVKVRPYISPMSDAYAAADFALCRSGAMTTAELAAWGIPALLVPLPSAAADHQTANAKALANAGAAVLLSQDVLSVTTLANAVSRLSKDPVALETMRKAALERARPHAADNIAAHILTMIDIK